MADFQIDFVITWVDGTDSTWQDEFNKYLPPQHNSDIREIRYRDYDLLKFWFRGVEKYAPWVRKVFFVTNGQKPEWLNIKHPNIQWIKHSDFIPEEYLPTFNSYSIEIFLNRIPQLSEHFVYFNDDFFILNKLKPDYFFHKGLPCSMSVLFAYSGGGTTPELMNSLELINRNFKKSDVLTKYFFKFINVTYGKYLLFNFCLFPWKFFTGFYLTHGPVSFLKSTFETVWKKEKQVLQATAKSKFRKRDNVSLFLFYFWDICTGKNSPKNIKRYTEYFELHTDSVSSIVDTIIKQKKPLITINDSEYKMDFFHIQSQLKKAFEKIFPDKSRFEMSGN